MEDLVDQVVYQGRDPLFEDIDQRQTCVVMTRRIRGLFGTRSRTTVLPGPGCGGTSGFIVWWNTDDPTVLGRVHSGMVQTISRIGFLKSAVWCERRHQNISPKSLDYFWHEQLGELFCYYRKAT